MQRNIPVFALLGVIAVVYLGKIMSSSDSIEYQGELVGLRRPYHDYGDYKNDPNNLAPGELGKAQQLVQSASVAKRFSDRMQVTQAVYDLKFPGYGLTSFGEIPQADGSVLALFAVEIPRSGNSRYLLFQGRDGAYTLIDDFVCAESAAIGAVSINGDQLLYANVRGPVVIERSRLPEH